MPHRGFEAPHRGTQREPLFCLTPSRTVREKVREKRRETYQLFVPTKEQFVVLFSPSWNNLFCVIVRFGYIGTLGFECFFSSLFLYSIIGL